VPRYFFHLRNDLDVPDAEGKDLPDLDAARAQALAFAVDMAAASALEHRKINLHHCIQVEDETGRVLHTILFGDAIAIETE
jgi:hypothetical protein